MTTRTKYFHKEIEKKWQTRWEESKAFAASEDTAKPKYYCLDMFPYPSGAGLHVGHVAGYTATDILSRHKRQQGYSVLHPMGWDSFGLPAEQYAIRTGTHPAKTTKENIDNFRRQLKLLGFSYDWDRELATSDEKFYKWTQWIFTKLYEKGLAYEDEMLVNFCPELGTVLSNEEIENGKAIEGGYPVERRPLRQWVLKITEYAERLLQDLDLLDWPESLKKMQRNWIGRSEGARCIFRQKDSNVEIEVFTTRQDTLFGTTYMVLSPEHPLVDNLTTPENKETVEAYKKEVASKSDLERTELSKHKTGAFTGSYVVNPINDEEVPVWIADYVLMGYGTGAIMAVPANDERDFEFAKKFGLKIVPVIDPDVENDRKKVPEGEDPKAYREKVLSGDAVWMGKGKATNSANDKLDINGLDVPEAKKKMNAWLEDNNCGRATVNYKLRDWLFSRQRYWGEPFPILHFEDGSMRTLELDELPLCPPEVKDYKPSGDGQSPLAKVGDWIEVTDPKTGKKAKRESNTMPQWAGSCWYYLRFCDPHNESKSWEEFKENYWMPIDMYIGGAEHAVLHLLYSRFWHKVLYDCGLVSTKEPFHALRNQGMITSRSFQQENGAYVVPEDAVKKGDKYFHKDSGEELRTQHEKMSKSKLNGVSPDEVIEEFGADSLRLYEMFMGPLEKEKVWNTDAVTGCRRFLARVYDVVISDKICDEETEEANKLGHRLVLGVENDIDKMLFNTAIAKMMEFMNDFTKLPKYPKSVVKMLVQCLMPFAPHLAEEAWEILGETSSLTTAPFPKGDPK